jgi:hypothetical protein
MRYLQQGHAARVVRSSATMCIRLFALLAVVLSTATSHAGPGKTCAAACKRMASCKLFPFKACMEECGRQGAEDTAKSRASNLVQARSSCAALAAELAPSKWICTAEGASVYGYDVGPGGTGDVQGTSSVFITGTGKTRSVAVSEAVGNCNSLMSVDLARSEAMNLDSDPRGEWGSAVSSECRVTQCWGPPRARRQK